MDSTLLPDGQIVYSNPLMKIIEDMEMDKEIESLQKELEKGFKYTNGVGLIGGQKIGVFYPEDLAKVVQRLLIEARLSEIDKTYDQNYLLSGRVKRLQDLKQQLAEIGGGL